MIEGPTIGDWTQYGWIPDEVSSFPARVRLLDSVWMVYYEANVGDERERAEMLELREQNAKLRELVAELWALADGYTPDDSELDTARDLMHELGIEVPE